MSNPNKRTTNKSAAGVPATGSWKSRVREKHQREHDAKHEDNHEGHCIKGCTTGFHGSPWPFEVSNQNTHVCDREETKGKQR